MKITDNEIKAIGLEQLYIITLSGLGLNFLFSFFHYQFISFARATWLREALRWKARKGGSRWGRGGKKASL
jgi:hypothetical protein